MNQASTGRPLPRPRRGDVWQVAFDPVGGHEQGGERPAVVVSAGRMNDGPSGLAIVIPVTRRDRGNPFDVPIGPPEGDRSMRTFVLSEGIRSISTERFRFRRGVLSAETVPLVEERLRIVLGLA
ncbi:MAG TPA: type II toxin-antitoxin system PemK/MazF family toxin [Thermomicrobiales bacterium]|nr:type II toxin-antitoxin system PemK/MazF family toxin [Thermomicrobiales bacterium]